MANIKIKRGSGVPAGLTHGELAYDTTNKRLYIGVTSASQLLTNTDGGVSSFNGLTGAVTGVTTGTANTFQALQSFAAGISASGGGTFTNGDYNFIGFRASTVGGDEGGQIDFGLPATNTGLCGGVVFDVYQNKVRIFESTGTNRGVFIDLTGVSAGVGTNLVGGGGAVSSVSGSGSGISVSPTTGAVVVQNTGVHSVNGSTGTVTNIAVTNAGQTFTGLQRFTNGISASGGTFGTVNLDAIITDSATALTISGGGGGINLSDSGSIILDTASPVYVGDYSGNVNTVYLEVNDANLMVTTANSSLTTTATYLANGEYIRNSTNGRVDIMPAPAGTTHYGMYFDTTSWGFGVVMGTVRSSDGAINTGGNFRFDVPVTISADTRFQLGSDGHYGFYRTDTGNNTGQIFALSNNANNSGALALVGYFDVGNANRSPATSHFNPNFYIYANGTTYANDFVRFEHDRTNANIISGGTSGIFIQAGSGTVGVCGSISADSFILTSRGIKELTGTTYTLLSTDNGDVITINASGGSTFTVPTGLPVGFSVTIINLSTNGVGITSAAGVTMNSYTNKFAIAGQHAAVGLISYSTNRFNLSGGLT